MPFFFLPGSYQNALLAYPAGCVAFFIALIPAEIITDWIFYKNNRSTLSAILFHFMVNFSGEALAMEQFTKVIQMVLLCVIAAVIVARDRTMFLQKDFRIAL
ncbi:MAG: hypothetical protein ACOC9B_05720 [Chloroflexota bacterium]